MSVLDVFNSDAFNVISLTDAVEKLPYVPSRIGGLGLFKDKPVATTVVAIEEKSGILSLVPVGTRGARATATTQHRPLRKLRNFQIPHFPQVDELLAESIQGVRAFGEESDTEVFSEVLNDKLTTLKQNQEVTFEWHRLGALKGVILDADFSTTIVNLFTEFGISQITQSYDFTDAGTLDDAMPVQDMKQKCVDLIRLMQGALGGTTFTGIHVLCGDTFFDHFIGHASVRHAYERYQDNVFARENQLGQKPFEFGGVSWENYRGSINGNKFIANTEAYAHPTGTVDLFTDYIAPADYIETVNTMGKRWYAKQERLPFDKGVQVEVQSNVLSMCKRPRCLIKLTDDTP